MVRSRHPASAYSRETHGASSIDFTTPSDRLYGSMMDLEAVTVVDLGAGSVTDAAIVTGGLTGGTAITGGTLPAYTFDITPPDLPSGISVASELIGNPDGSKSVAIIVTMTPPNILVEPNTDYFSTVIEATNRNDGDPVSPSPDWSNPIFVTTGKGVSYGYVLGVAGSTQYWVRMRTTDVQGNYSIYSATYSVVTVGDTEAPSVPQSPSGAAGYKSIGVRWENSDASDLMFYQVRYAPDLAGAPNTSLWEYRTTRASSFYIDGLTADVAYWAQVRAVDFSRNVATSDADPTAVDYLSYPEHGWTANIGPFTPTLVGAADVAFNSVITNILAANYIDASTINTGLLKVGTVAGNSADGIEIYNTDVRVGRWTEDGLYVGSLADGLPDDLSASSYVKLTDAGVYVYRNGAVLSAMTPDGLNAEAVTFGALPGGHNLILNSSFELSDFVAAPSTKVWDVAADWVGTQVSATNIVNGASAVTISAVTY